MTKRATVVLWAPGSRLVVHVERLPSPEAWASEARRVGVAFEEEPPALAVRTNAIDVRDATTRAAFAIEVEPSTSLMTSGEIDDPRELAVMNRARWGVWFRLPEQMPDRLPTAVAVSLAAAGDGICYHFGMDRAVHTGHADTLMRELCWYAEHITDPTHESLAGIEPFVLVPSMVDLICARLPVPLDRRELLRSFESFTVNNFVAVHSRNANDAERRRDWVTSYLGYLFIWLQAGEPRAAIHEQPGGRELAERVRELLAEGSWREYRSPE